MGGKTMIITDTLIKADGTTETREIEVADNYFDSQTVAQPTTEERLSAAEAALTALMGV